MACLASQQLQDPGVARLLRGISRRQHGGPLPVRCTGGGVQPCHTWRRGPGAAGQAQPCRQRLPQAAQGPGPLGAGAGPPALATGASPRLRQLARQLLYPRMQLRIGGLCRGLFSQ